MQIARDSCVAQKFVPHCELVALRGRCRLAARCAVVATHLSPQHPLSCRNAIVDVRALRRSSIRDHYESVSACVGKQSCAVSRVPHVRLSNQVHFAVEWQLQS